MGCAAAGGTAHANKPQSFLERARKNSFLPKHSQSQPRINGFATQDEAEFPTNLKSLS